MVNTYANTEVKSIIKESYGNGCEAILLLQARCARITPQDTVRIEEKFYNTHIEPNKTATQYIRRFRDAKLLAKSVGIKIEPSKLIDKFLLSMRFNKRYILTAQHLSNQRRHEEMSNDYTHIQLTMMEVESHLYANDKNSTNQYQAYQVNVNKSSISYHRPQYDQNRVNFSNQHQHKWDNRLCFISGAPDHQKRHCPKFKPRLIQLHKKTRQKKLYSEEKGIM